MPLRNDRLDSSFMRQFSWFMGVTTVIYFFSVTFLHIPKENFNNVGTIIGFLMGTIVGSIMGVYFGGSKSKTNEQTSSIVTEQEDKPTITTTTTDSQKTT